MKAVLLVSIIIVTNVKCSELKKSLLQDMSNCEGHDHCPGSQACIGGSCADPCESLCGQNTHCTTLLHIPACACKEGHTGNPFIRCNLQDEKKTATALVKMIATPVIYTNGNGGGSDEIEAFASDNHRMFDAHGNVCAAWWVPYDNIPDLSAIHFINVEPSGTQVKLHVRGVARTGRVRIKIFAFICG